MRYEAKMMPVSVVFCVFSLSNVHCYGLLCPCLCLSGKNYEVVTVATIGVSNCTVYFSDVSVEAAKKV